MDNIYQVYSYSKTTGYTQLTPYINALDVLSLQQAVNQMPLYENYEQGNVRIVRIDAHYRFNNKLAYVIRIKDGIGHFVVMNADTSFYVREAGLAEYQPLQTFQAP